MGVVVLVQADPEMCDLMAHKLRGVGHEVLTADRGEEGLKLTRDRHPDLLVVDAHLPDTNGLEVCGSLRRDRNPRVARTAIVVTSSTASETEAEAAFDAGADDYVSMPSLVSAFIDRLDGEF